MRSCRHAPAVGHLRVFDCRAGESESAPATRGSRRLHGPRAAEDGDRRKHQRRHPGLRTSGRQRNQHHGSMPQKLARRIVFRVVSLLCGDQSPAGAELHPYDCGRTTRNPSAFRKSCWTSSMRYSPRSRAAVCALRSGKALRPSTTAPSTRSNCCTTKAHLASSRRLNRCIGRRRPRGPAGRSTRRDSPPPCGTPRVPAWCARSTW